MTLNIHPVLVWASKRVLPYDNNLCEIQLTVIDRGLNGYLITLIDRKTNPLMRADLVRVDCPFDRFRFAEVDVANYSRKPYTTLRLSVGEDAVDDRVKTTSITIIDADGNPRVRLLNYTTGFMHATLDLWAKDVLRKQDADATRAGPEHAVDENVPEFADDMLGR